MRELTFRENSLEHVEYWLANDRKVLTRIFRILRECQRTPFEGIGKPEPLKNNLSGLWSRRIDDSNRIVYEATKDSIVVYSLKGHY